MFSEAGDFCAARHFGSEDFSNQQIFQMFTSLGITAQENLWSLVQNQKNWGFRLEKYVKKIKFKIMGFCFKIKVAFFQTLPSDILVLLKKVRSNVGPLLVEFVSKKKLLRGRSETMCPLFIYFWL